MEDFTLTPPPAEIKAPPFTVTLRRAPEVFSARRAALEEQFRLALMAQFPDDQAAWQALHVAQDAIEHVPLPLQWEAAEAVAMQAVGVTLPPGAYFECELAWPDDQDDDEMRTAET